MLEQARAIRTAAGVYYYGSSVCSIYLLRSPLAYAYQGGACLVTMIDSGECPGLWLSAEAAKHLASGKPELEFRLVHGNFLAWGTVLAWLLGQADIFHGFDELYLFDRVPHLLPSHTQHYAPNGLRFSESLPEPLVSHIVQTDASGFVADGTGIGLNWVFRQNVLCSRLLESLTAAGG